MGAERTVIVKSDGNDYTRKEGVAHTSTILPGMLIYKLSTGKWAAHATAGGIAQAAFALEDLRGDKDIDDTYTADEQIQVAICRRGCEVNVLLADGETALIGSILVSNGDGYFKVLTADSSGTVLEDYPLVIAQAALDMSDSSGADPSSQRITCEVM